MTDGRLSVRVRAIATPSLGFAVLVFVTALSGTSWTSTVLADGTWPPAGSNSSSVYSRPTGNADLPVPMSSDSYSSGESAGPAPGYDPASPPTSNPRPNVPLGLPAGGPAGIAPPTLPPRFPAPQSFEATAPPTRPATMPPSAPAGDRIAQASYPAPARGSEDVWMGDAPLVAASREASLPPGNATGRPPRASPVGRLASAEPPAGNRFSGSPIPAELDAMELVGAEVNTPLPQKGDAGATRSLLGGNKSPWMTAGTTLASLAVVIGLFVAVMYAQKRFRGTTVSAKMPSEIIEPLGTIPAGPRAEYRLVRFADRVLLLHAVGTTVTTLSEVTDLDTVEHLVTLCRQNRADALPNAFRRIMGGAAGQSAPNRRVRAVA